MNTDEKDSETPETEEEKGVEEKLSESSKGEKRGPHRWKKGQPSANPGGRPKGLAARVREKTNDGQVPIDLLVDIAKGRIKASTRDRIEASKILLDRGHGKAPEIIATVDLGDEAKEALADLTAEDLRSLAGSAPEIEPEPVTH